MAWTREIEVYLKGKRDNPVVHSIYVPTRVLLKIFGSKIYDRLKKIWIEDDFNVVWSRKVTEDIADKLMPFIGEQIVWDFQKNDYLFTTSEIFDESVQAARIGMFMSWFKNNEIRLLNIYDQQDVGQSIDDQLDRVDPRLGWEIGPADEGSMYFAVSPDLDKTLFLLAKQLVNLSFSYQLNGFEFRIGRQRRPWSDIIQIAKNEKSYFSEIDISEWRYMVFRVPDSELLDIVFSCGENCPFSDNDLDEVATLVAVGLLGEMVVLERVDQIEVVKAFDGERAKKAKPAEWLPYAFGMKPL
jgi:hypothetical protein